MNNSKQDDGGCATFLMGLFLAALVGLIIGTLFKHDYEDRERIQELTHRIEQLEAR